MQMTVIMEWVYGHKGLINDYNLCRVGGSLWNVCMSMRLGVQ